MGSSLSKRTNNLLDSLPVQGTVHIVMLGLDSAGKTTTLYRMKLGQYMNTVPTIGFNCEKVLGTVGKSKGINFLVWDVGGQEKLRPLWRSYTRCTDGILFVIDSVDLERMEEAKIELMRIAACPGNQGVPLLILANKQDLPGALNCVELENLLGLNELMVLTTGSTIMQALKKGSISSSIEFKIDSKYNKTFSSTQISENILNNSSTKCSFSQGDRNTHPLENQNRTFYPTDTKACKSWYIQPTCAITGEGLQEGLGVLYDMILNRKKLNKTGK